LTCKPTNKIKARREQHYCTSSVLSNKLQCQMLQMSTQNYIVLNCVVISKSSGYQRCVKTNFDEFQKFGEIHEFFTNFKMASHKFPIYDPDVKLRFNSRQNRSKSRGRWVCSLSNTQGSGKGWAFRIFFKSSVKIMSFGEFCKP